MNSKKFFILLFAAIFSSRLFAAENEVALRVKSGHETGSRSIPEKLITASYDDEAGYLYFTFSNATPSRTLVYSTNDSQTALIQQSSLSGLSTTVDISSLPIGNYLVEIYAFDCWWIGYFEID